MLLGDAFAMAATDGNQMEPAATWNATTNEYLVVWTDALTSYDIYGQRVAADGELLGSRFAVSTASGTSRRLL